VGARICYSTTRDKQAVHVGPPVAWLRAMRRRARLIGLAAGMALGASIGIAKLVARRRRRTVLCEAYSTEECTAMHAIKIARIASQLRAHDGSKPLSLRKAAPPHQVPKYGDLRRHDDKVDISDLTAIISIDPVRRLCTAESGAMFQDVVAATLRHGLVPIVVPELKTITIGGAVSGCSVESMSFRHGGFHDTCIAYEVVTATGEVLTCTPDNANSLVFQMIHGSFGTLGILAQLTFRLVPAKPFVRVEYERHATLESYRDAIMRHSRDPQIDFIDGIIHTPNELVLSIGRFADSAPYTNAYDWTQVYYLSTRERSEDYLRTEDYLFRYDRGVTNVHPKSWIGRLLLGKLLDSGAALRLADTFHFLLERDRPTITLDVFLPISRMGEFLAWYEREFGHFPLWCVPYRRVHDYPWLANEFYAGLEDGMFVDLAIYGMEQKGDKPYHKLMEEKLAELGGVKTLISHNYYTPEEFWQTFNKPNYAAVKAITDPNNLFRDLYEKTCKAAMGQP
jgi:FAD/FMN-containing dehydrogenase